MYKESEFYCPDCDNGYDAPQPQNRRNFIRSTAAAAVALGAPSILTAQDNKGVKPIKPGQTKPAENIIRELRASLTDEQKTKLVLPYDHGGKKGLSRLAAYNSPFGGLKIGEVYDKKQQELVHRALRAMLSSDDAVERVSRYGRWDSSGSFEGCGAVLFGDPSDEAKPFSWVFSGHHLTLRCDGNSAPGVAFGGPIYYGHSTPGYSDRNVYYYQTEAAQNFYDSLDSSQQKEAVAKKNPGDGQRGITFPKDSAPKPGIGFADLNAEQKGLLETVMKTALDPFRKEDADEVMELVKSNGGMEKIHLAFYRENSKDKDAGDRWSFWRIEGPGFIWNYRALPHVHCFVNIAAHA